jgi:sugar phosphate isomerase/epimerase
VDAVKTAGLRVDDITEVGGFDLARPDTWDAHRQRLMAAVETASAVGAPCIVFLSGSPGPLSWEDASGALEQALAPVRAEAAGRGVALALENTSPLRLDLSFVTTLVDATELAARLGLAVCMEVNSCWAERRLTTTMRDAIHQFALIQLSDFVVGSLSTPDRAVPGDGDIPLVRIVADALDAGYAGVFDLELVGPRIEAEGYRSAVRRGIAAVSAMLEDATS